MLKNSEVFGKALKYIVIMFVMIFFGYIFSGDFIYSISQEYVNNYLSIYTNAHDLLLQQELPMWSWNFFLGGNFLGTQSIYSIYNPFFLMTLFFSASTLPYLFLPLLLLKTVLASGALYLYMKQTKWFSKQTVAIASIIYIFNGWFLTNLNEVNTIELLIFVPLVLYGVEKLLTNSKKRYLVAAFSLLVLSHFAFTIIFLPFLIGYIIIRLYAIHHDNKIEVLKDLKQLLLAVIIIIGVNMICILPILLAFDGFSLQLNGEFSLTSLLALGFRGLFPPLHETFNGRVSFVEQSMSQISLYQSLLVIMLVPQFIKMVTKNVRVITTIGYITTVLVVLFMPCIKFMNVSALTTFNSNS
ncbi:MAG: YfhO family protein, partial [Turicibacter sp.]